MIEIVVSTKAAEGVLVEPEQLDGVVNLSVVCGASVKPPGDIVTVHMLNRDVDAVPAAPPRPSIIDEHATRAIDDDVDESPWEEIEQGRRHHGRQLVRHLAARIAVAAVAWHWSSWGCWPICCRRAGHGEPRGAGCSEGVKTRRRRGESR